MIKYWADSLKKHVYFVQKIKILKKLQSYCKLLTYQLLLRKLDCNSRMNCKIVAIVESALKKKSHNLKDWILTLLVAKKRREIKHIV